MREKLSSRLGFILLSAGCAIGLGNVWRFPYVAGQDGGGCFAAFYLLFSLVLGIPVLMMEFAAGRAAQRSIARLHETLTPEKRLWRGHGVLGLVGSICILIFYTTITGWTLLYFLKMASGALAGLTPDGVGAVFDAMLADPGQQIGAMAAACAIAAIVCAAGLQSGLERVAKWMMLALLLLIVALAVNSVLMDRDGRGVRFFLLPDISRMRSVGVLKVAVDAMNQSFYSLSLGIGCMSIFGSYIGKEKTLLGEAVNVAVLDTLVAVFAGLIIIPACFAHGVELGQGPGLVFVALPNVFNQLPCGRLWGSLFFLFISFAALTSVFAVFENIVACIRDCTGWGRVTTCALTGVGLVILSVPCVLGFNVWSAFHPFGGETNVLDLEDFLVSNCMFPLGSIAFAVYCCHRFGWGWKRFSDEANAGQGPKVAAWMRPYCAYVLPLIILSIFIIGLVDRFK